jgi:hypothetical protein
MGAATPFQSGGSPAQLYILWRCGAKISDGVLISLVNFIATLFFFLASTIAVLILLPSDLFGKNFAPVMQTGFVVIGGVTGFVLMILAFPKIGLVLVRQFFLLIPLRSPKFFALRDRVPAAFEAEVHHFSKALRQILRRKKWSLVVVVLATLALFSNKYLMGYVVARALGQEAPLGIFFGLQVIQLFLIYYAPTPGASGVAELSSVWLMEKLMPQSALLVYAVLWRFVSTILGAILGGVVLSIDMRHWAQRT